MDKMTVRVTVNGAERQADIAPRTMLVDLLRDALLLTGTHVGCDSGVCGACTVLMDGAPIRSCITLAAACDGATITTVEGLAGPRADTLRECFSAEHGLQCGFCTPGMLISATDLLERNPRPTREEIRSELAGNLCRCTGYVGIVNAVERAATRIAASDKA